MLDKFLNRIVFDGWIGKMILGELGEIVGIKTDFVGINTSLFDLLYYAL